jgi:hypothetical protein
VASFDNYLTLIPVSVQRALRGRTPANLRATSFAMDQAHRRLILRAHFEQTLTQADLDAIYCADAEVQADLPD